MGNTDAPKIVIAAANSAEKPRLGVSSVIFSPTVLMTLQPQVANPITIPTPPNSNAQLGVSDFVLMTFS